MKENVKVSVIVPVYNIEDYLERCISSILNQSYTNLELILINDGSEDAGGNICDKYAESDARVKVFHQKNSGVSVARNKGIENSTGQYITFVDGDDWVENDSFEKNAKSLSRNYLDILICRSFSNDERKLGKEHYRFNNSMLDTFFDGESLIIMQQYIRGSVWGVFYSRSFLENNNILFPINLKNGEDSIFSHLSFIFAKKIGFSDVHLYNVYERQGSASRNWDFNRVFLMVNNIKYLNDIEEGNIFTDRAKNILDYSRYSAISYIYNKLYTCFTVDRFRELTYHLRQNLNHKLDIGDISGPKNKVRTLNFSLNLFGILVISKCFFKDIINK